MVRWQAWQAFLNILSLSLFLLLPLQCLYIFRHLPPTPHPDVNTWTSHHLRATPAGGRACCSDFVVARLAWRAWESSMARLPHAALDFRTVPIQQLRKGESVSLGGGVRGSPKAPHLPVQQVVRSDGGRN